ncbi:MAG: hypothetical protein H6Q67_1962 [Firmicutes bacterium]|nr:hypothetical protein [Bacillota bacterium]
MTDFITPLPKVSIITFLYPTAIGSRELVKPQCHITPPPLHSDLCSRIKNSKVTDNNINQPYWDDIQFDLNKPIPGILISLKVGARLKHDKPLIASAIGAASTITGEL